VVFLNAVLGKHVSNVPPVWLMRQAGRYMQSYQKLRKRYSFLQLCKEVELIVKVTHLPIDQFQFDAAIVFSDILLVCEALGQKLSVEDRVGPILEPTLKRPLDIMVLDVEAITERLSFVYEAIRELKKTLKVPLIGFAGSPFTLASYMIEGKGKHEAKKTREWIARDPVSFSYLLDLLAQVIAQHLNAQIAAGADCVQIFESAAHHLTQEEFWLFVLPYLQKVLAQLHPCPTIVFGLNTSLYVEQYAALKPAAISFDAHADLALIQKKLHPSIAIQGNLDPVLLTRSKEEVKGAAKKICEEMRGSSRFIFNLGHGVLPHTPEENVYTLLDTVRSSLS
jgi:uroporphyrinogen decarboxylase